MSIQNVLICIPVLLIGGTEIQTLNLVNVFVEAGYRVTVCCYYEYDAAMVLQMKQTGAEVILMELKRSDGLWHLFKKLRVLLRQMNPDIIHVQYIAPGLLPIIAARLAGIKTIFATVHQPGRVYGWKEKVFLRIAARLCTAFFCNSKAVEKSWFGDSQIFNPEKIDKKRKHFTIYNGVDVDRIERIVKEADSDRIRESLNIRNKKVVGVVGRLRGEKGQAVLLKAMVDVIKTFPDTVLLVVGDGPDRQHLEQMAIQLGINDNILWLGQRKQQEVFELYSIMYVVAVPSIFEGFGLTAAEAMAAGVPVIASAVDGLMEVIEDGVNGYLVPVDDSKKLSIALINVLSKKQKSVDIANKGKEHIKNNFSIDKFAVSMTTAYQSFVS